MAYNHRRVFQVPPQSLLQVDLPPAPLPATVTPFPAPFVDPTPQLPPVQEAVDVHLQAQLYTVQLQLQVLAINVAQQDYPADDEDDDMMVDEVDDYGFGE
ncbi:MAG: hypothetical protein JOS17DRAFT_821015 [Linnemannia elongata]|nr:MAG: hypothetical protein JOS17DRAFT_821015 [Linnemannia elongata]